MKNSHSTDGDAFLNDDLPLRTQMQNTEAVLALCSTLQHVTVIGGHFAEMGLLSVSLEEVTA